MYMYIYVHMKDACRLPSAELVILDNEYINENINGNINSTLAFVVTPADKSVRKMIDICVYCARGSHRHGGCIGVYNNDSSVATYVNASSSALLLSSTCAQPEISHSHSPLIHFIIQFIFSNNALELFEGFR